MEKNFEWQNWKKFISKKFLPCPGISSWHQLKITQDSDFILVADHVGDAMREVRIMNESVLDDMPEIIIPEGLSHDCCKELEFLKSFIKDPHVNLSHQIIKQLLKGHNK